MVQRQDWIIVLETKCGCKRSFIKAGSLDKTIVMPLRTKVASGAKAQNAMDLASVGQREFALVSFDKINYLARYVEIG